MSASSCASQTGVIAVANRHTTARQGGMLIRRARVIPTTPARRSSVRSRPARPARTRDRGPQDRRAPAARNGAWCRWPRAFRDSAPRSLPLLSLNPRRANYERAAEGFAERYLEMLAASGTKHHSELLAPFGLEARDPAFWQGGLGVIERIIGDLEWLE